MLVSASRRNELGSDLKKQRERPRKEKGSAGAPPAAFGASPDASSEDALAAGLAPPVLGASGGAPLAAGGAPALPIHPALHAPETLAANTKPWTYRD